MKITELVVHNFGVFAGRHHMDLSGTHRDRPIALIGALNGGGKTTVLEALQVGLYGAMARTGRRSSRAYNEYLASLINDQVEEEEGAAVEIEFEEKERGVGKLYRVVRTWRKRRKNISETLEVFKDGAIDPYLSENWQDGVDQFLPEKLCNLFLFDGEQIEALADPEESGRILETAVSGLLGLDLVDQALTDLKVTKSRGLQKGSESDSKRQLDDLSSSIGKLLQRKGILEDRQRELREKYAAARNRQDRADLAYKKQGGGIREQMQDLENQKAELLSERETIRSILRDRSAGPLPLVMLESQLNALKARGEAEDEIRVKSEALPLLARRDRDVLSWIKEVFGDDIAGVSEIESRLQADKERLEAESQDGIQVGLPKTAVSQISGLLSERFCSATDEIRKLLAERDRIEEQLTSTERKLAEVPDEASLTEVISERESARSQVESLTNDLSEIDEQIAQINEYISAYEAKKNDIEKEIQLSGLKSELDERVMSTNDRVSSALSSFREKVLRRHVGKLEEVILESYKTLLRKEGLISKLQISPDTLRLTLFSRDDAEIEPSRLSAGERQLLATAILWGLGKASGRALPVVIDTPLGRLDSTHREKLVRHYFPNASHQVILLSTDEEIDGAYYEVMKPYIGCEYEISFDESINGSRVSSGYPFEEAA